MSLKATSLLIQAAPLPSTFRGNPNDFLAAMVARMKILSPNGTNFIFIGDTAPTSNVGPWLKDGTKWYVWSEDTKQYVPLDVSDSVGIPFFIGNATPSSQTPPVWLRTTLDASDVAPNNFGEPIGWQVWDGSAWVPFNSIPLSGPTASRPTAPANLQQFYDTDISTLIWWERGMWRTVSGSPGDIKAVATLTLQGALTQNPGWSLLGGSDSNQLGRVLIGATKDPGATPQNDFTSSLPAGVTPHAAGTSFGQGNQVQMAASTTQPYPPQLSVWHLVKA
jgi:hypothetical protein